MAHLTANVLVIGAGVLGLASAAELALRGHSVTLIDPGGPNASSVAAGMIAPAMEALLEHRASGGAVDHAALFTRARDRFAVLAKAAGVQISRQGAVWAGQHGRDVYRSWLDWGFEPTPEPATAADWQIDPAQAMAQLAAVPGVSRLTDQVESLSSAETGWTVSLTSGGARVATQVVVATGALGYLKGPQALASVLQRVTPIRGQLGHVEGLSVDRTWRAEGIYVAPAPDGAVIGATMDVGRTDAQVDAAQSADLVRRAESLLGQTLPHSIRWRVGIRGASPDGLPLAGTVLPGLTVALAPRRNGWLMSALVAATVADAIEDRAPGPDAAVLNPLRF